MVASSIDVNNSEFVSIKFNLFFFWYQLSLSNGWLRCFLLTKFSIRKLYRETGNFHRSGSFVKDAAVLNRECIFVAIAFMEMNNWCSGLRIYMLLRPCLHRSNLKASWKFGISWKNWPFFKTVLKYWMAPYW